VDIICVSKLAEGHNAIMCIHVSPTQILKSFKSVNTEMLSDREIKTTNHNYNWYQFTNRGWITCFVNSRAYTAFVGIELSITRL